MRLSDEQLLEGLREAGHQEAATALEQKVTAQAAAAGGEPDRPEGPDGGGGRPAPPDEPSGRERLASAQRKTGYPNQEGGGNGE